MMKYLVGLFYFYLIRTISLLKLFVKKKKSVNKPSDSKTNLDPATIPKFVNQLVKPPEYKPFLYKKRVKLKDKLRKKKEKRHLYFVDISKFKQQLLPDNFPQTTVWGYGGLIKDPNSGCVKYSRSSPGATFEAVRDTPVMVK